MGGWGEKEGGLREREEGWVGGERRREGEGVAEFKRVLMDGTLDKGMWPNFVFSSPYSR